MSSILSRNTVIVTKDGSGTRDINDQLDALRQDIDNMDSEKINVITAKSTSDTPDTYPAGITTFTTFDTGWTERLGANPNGTATVTTEIGDYGPYQKVVIRDSSGDMLGVIERTGTSNSWDSFVDRVERAEFAAHLNDYVKHPGYATATGLANNYAVTLSPAPTAYVDGMAVAVKINVNNTGASTINVNGLGAKAIKKPNGNDVAAGNLKADSIYTLRYNAATENFILQGEGGSGNAQPSDVLSGKTFTNDSGEQTGTMPNRTGHVDAQSISSNGTTLRLRPPQGYFPGDSGNSVQWNEPNWTPENIPAGLSMFGLAGTLQLGKKWASGLTTSQSSGLEIRGLDFQPGLVIWIVRNVDTNVRMFVGTIPPSVPNDPPIPFMNGSTLEHYGGIVTRRLADNSASIDAEIKNSHFHLYPDGFKVGTGGVSQSVQWYAVEW